MADISAAYTGTKGAQSLARYLAKYEIIVNSIPPGISYVMYIFLKHIFIFDIVRVHFSFIPVIPSCYTTWE